MISRLATNLHAWGLLLLVWSVLGAFWLGSYYGGLGRRVAAEQAYNQGFEKAQSEQLVTYDEMMIREKAKQRGLTPRQVAESQLRVQALVRKHEDGVRN